MGVERWVRRDAHGIRAQGYNGRAFGVWVVPRGELWLGREHDG